MRAVGLVVAVWAVLAAGGVAKAATSNPPPPTMSSQDILRHFIPKDILDVVAALSDEQRAKVCQGTLGAKLTLATLKPENKLAGETSQMADVDETVGMTTNEYSEDISGLASAIIVRGDDAQKTLLIKIMAKWARAHAYLDTRDCFHSSCGTQWTTKRGHELSVSKDSQMVLERILPSALAYYALVSDFKADELADDHQAIRMWLRSLEARLPGWSRGSKPEIGFGEGLAFQTFTAPLFDLLEKGDAAFLKRVTATGANLGQLLMPDGSMKNRTTRGSRAAWYHYGALNEALVELEISRANGIDLYPKYSKRIEEGVKIFLDAVDDIRAGRNTPKNPAGIYHWARADYQSAGDPLVQDFAVPGTLSANGSSWMPIYLVRFGDTDNAKRLRKLLLSLAELQETDGSQGINYGCLYRLADPELFQREQKLQSAIDQSKILEAVSAVAETHPPTLSTQPVTFEKISFGQSGDGYHGDVFDVNVTGLVIDGKRNPFVSFQLLVNYDPIRKKSIKTMNALRIAAYRFLLDKEDQQIDFGVCGTMAFDGDTVRLHYGREANLNRCVTTSMDSNDKELWTSVFANLPSWVSGAAASGDKFALALQPMFAKKLAEQNP